MEQLRLILIAGLALVGVLLYQMCALTYPFHSHDGSQMALMKEVLRSDYKDIPSLYSDELKLLLKHLLDKDGSKRPNIN